MNAPPARVQDRPRRPAARRPAAWRPLAGLLIAGLALLMAGCGSNRWQGGPLPLDDPDALQTMVPEDPAAAADFYTRLAEARYFAGEYDAAARTAERALELVPGHGGARYVQGLLLEHQERWREALAIYADADDHAAMDRALLQRMRSRQAVVNREILRQNSRVAVQEEEAPDTFLSPSTLVVHRFQPLGATRTDSVLALGVTDFLTSSFALIDGLTVIDRTRQELLAEEIARSRGLAFDERTRLTAAMVGAGLSISGEVGPAAEDPDRIRASYLLDDLNAGPDAGRHLEVTTSDRYLLQDLGKQVVAVAKDQLQLSLPRELEEQLARPPTRSHGAFLAYAEGLLLEEEGRYPAARQAFGRAIRIDPGFGQAQLGAERVAGVGAAGAAVALAEPVLAALPPAADLMSGVLDLTSMQVDELLGSRHQEPDETNVLAATILIEIVVNPR